ncbi:unnamed protein product [Knipowitschia caucasica]|uniref:Uncharacterized protein n=1 Tax=Knipowitschia caucasica TaxID=637954 RepID=A0AAV2MCY8_KNICA
MKVHLLIPFSVAVSVASLALMKFRVEEIIDVERRDKFLDVKLRVTDDVLNEYKKEKMDTMQKMEKQKLAQEELKKGIDQLVPGEKKGEMDACSSAKKKVMDEMAILQAQQKTFQEDSTKEKTAWEAEIATLKEKLTAESPICQYLKPGSSLPGTCPEKKEEPKPEPPKKEEIKEAPKPEEEKKAEEVPKKEEAKAEEVKPDASKPEEAKQEAPKQ